MIHFESPCHGGGGGVSRPKIVHIRGELFFMHLSVILARILASVFSSSFFWGRGGSETSLNKKEKPAKRNKRVPLKNSVCIIFSGSRFLMPPSVGYIFAGSEAVTIILKKSCNPHYRGSDREERNT